MLSIHQKNQGPYENVKSKKNEESTTVNYLGIPTINIKKKICRPCTVKSPNRI